METLGIPLENRKSLICDHFLDSSSLCVFD
jgi:hypothetical protein